MAKDISKVMMKLEDELMWDTALELSNQKLLVIDCHQEWCGICEAILPTISRILLDYDAAEERFAYASASISKLSGKIQASFTADFNVNLDKNGCLPLFAVYKNKGIVALIVGVDSPTLLQQISLNIPDKPLKE
eukprot:gene6535-8978_t